MIPQKQQEAKIKQVNVDFAKLALKNGDPAPTDVTLMLSYKPRVGKNIRNFAVPQFLCKQNATHSKLKMKRTCKKQLSLTS